MLVVKLVLVYSCPVYAVALKKYIKKYITTIMSVLIYWYKIDRNTDFPENCGPNTRPTGKYFPEHGVRRESQFCSFPIVQVGHEKFQKRRVNHEVRGKFTRKY